MRFSQIIISRLGAIALLLSIVASVSAAAPRDGATLYSTECASCHDSAAARTPTRATLADMPTATIIRSLETGVMRVVGNFRLNGPERVAVAEYITGSPFDPNWNTSQMLECRATNWPSKDLFEAPHWNGWGNGNHNKRYQGKGQAKLTKYEVTRLGLKWAFAFPGETIAESQPTVVDGRLFVGSRSGSVYALDAKTACLHWQFQADAPVKNSIVIGTVNIDDTSRTVAFFGDLAGTAYAIDARTGKVIWQRTVDDFPASRLMGSFILVGDQLFVPITATESTLVAASDAVCCVFRGSVVSLNPATGAEQWRRYTIAETPIKTGENSLGNPTFGPSGATIWSAPTYDPVLDRIYVGTGENASNPATKTSDAILAIDAKTSDIKWTYQGLAGDAWNMSCGTSDRTNCPEAPAGLDYDMGSSPSLTTMINGKRILIAAQKSGVVHALDPDNGGKLLWRRKVAEGGILGGIEWGPANDGHRLYVALGDMRWNTPDLLDPKLALDANVGGGVVALDLNDGSIIWEAPPIECGERTQCSPAQTAAVTAIPEVVFAGGMSGHLRAFDAENGKVIWTYDTVREFEAVNGAKGRGGALDASGPVVVDGWVYVVSGYSKWGGLPGNVLLGFTPIAEAE
ncbi:MAG TPA: cytochrome C oxidase Cbb3 [Gammaproteobacteria bacterium]|nr:cytochrome C oxidase Cbb3 [Gammaproteobacteria bacterium]|tara:strand:- start:271 stop:2157 length:1887 start_codon:yes stop_codon:yes gene_type:complete